MPGIIKVCALIPLPCRLQRHGQRTQRSGNFIWLVFRLLCLGHRLRR